MSYLERFIGLSVLLILLLALGGLVRAKEAGPESNSHSADNRHHHQVTGESGTVGGGVDNQAGGQATVGGGFKNKASGFRSAISGGSNNVASSGSTVIGGGNRNTASFTYATVGGGSFNTASALNATVGGGSGNMASGNRTTVGGGTRNRASGLEAVVGGGTHNTAGNAYATVSGGLENMAGGRRSTVGGGAGNIASGEDATIGGGLSNRVMDRYGTVSGGRGNLAGNMNDNVEDARYATVGGGQDNMAINLGATVGGGLENSASGALATVCGGFANEAAGDYSLAAGHRARIEASHDGTFLYADSSDFDFNSVTTNEFAVRATGGVRFVTGINNLGVSEAGVRLAEGGNSWQSLSDRAAKANVSLVDGPEILTRLVAVPISTWHYKSQDPSIRHIGPMAQDFYHAFGLGEGDKYINTVDADGVALAAIQGLYQLVQEQEAQIGTLLSENASQQEQIAALEARLIDLERAIERESAQD